MSNILIRRATKQDIDALVALEHACFTTDLMTRRSYQRLIHSPTADIFVATHHSSLIGSGVFFYRKNSATARFYSLAVLAAFRQQGVAIALCQKLEQSAHSRGCHSAVLEVRRDNPSGIRFHHKNGYQEFGHYLNFYEDGCDALRMRKSLMENNP